MDEKPPNHPAQDRTFEPTPEARLSPPDPDLIHISPEMAIAEADVHPARGEFVRGTSLWKDAWRRLLKNKLSVFGLVVVSLIRFASILGPPVIKRTLGLTPDYFPSTNAKRFNPLQPFT